MFGNLIKTTVTTTRYRLVQLFVTRANYCDFIVWSPNGITVDRIFHQDKFFYDHLEKITDFFKYSILAELVGKWLTRRTLINEDGVVEEPTSEESAHISSEVTDDARMWCYCEQPSTDELVECKNKECTILKFHMGCLRMRCPPKENQKWYCPSCRKLPKFSRSRKNKGGKKL